MISLPSSLASRQLKRRIIQVKRWLAGKTLSRVEAGKKFSKKIQAFCKRANKRVNKLVKKWVKKWAQLAIQPLLAPSCSKLHTHSVALGVGVLMFNEVRLNQMDECVGSIVNNEPVSAALQAVC